MSADISSKQNLRSVLEHNPGYEPNCKLLGSGGAQAGRVQHPRQMVFIFASNFEFSTASTSTYFSVWSVGVLDAAGLSTAIGAPDTAGLAVAVEALDALGLPSAYGGAVLL